MKLIKKLGSRIVGKVPQRKYFALYECPDCEKHFERNVNDVSRMKPKRCGACTRLMGNSRRTHSMAKTKVYCVRATMIARCYNLNNNMYHRYGGRGITVCKEWLESFENFYRDMGDAPKGMQIDREDNDGNYEPSNCRWVTPKENARNSTKTQITEDDASVIKTLLLYGGITAVKISEMFNVRPSLIYNIKYNKVWKDISPLPV